MVRETKEKTARSIWEKRNIRKLLTQPVGAPIKLTTAEAIAIAEAEFGARPDLPPGSRYVKSLKGIWRGLAREPRARRSS